MSDGNDQSQRSGDAVGTSINSGLFAIATVSATLSSVALLGMLFYGSGVFVDLRGLLRWLALGYAAILVAMLLVKVALSAKRSRAEVNEGTVLPLRLKFELNSASAWVERVMLTPLGLLAVIGMTKDGIHIVVALTVAIVGCFAIDFAAIASNLAQQHVRRRWAA